MGLAEVYDYYWNTLADERTKDWTLVSTPWCVLSMIFAYLYFVLRCGPNYMKNKQPYSLKTFIKYYNIFQIVANALLVYNVISAGWFTEISIFCEPYDYSYNPNPYKLARLMWWSILLKLSDFIETGVFVLRKKDRQVSFLHLYHHVSTVMINWLSTRYIAGAMSTFLLIVNCSIHVIMYTYYYLSSGGPKVRKAITPFKPFLTIIQMVQFWILMLYCLQGLSPNCDVPKFPSIMMIVNLLINFFLFFNFYQQTYKKTKKQ